MIHFVGKKKQAMDLVSATKQKSSVFAHWGYSWWGQKDFCDLAVTVNVQYATPTFGLLAEEIFPNLGIKLLGKKVVKLNFDWAI